MKHFHKFDTVYCLLLLMYPEIEKCTGICTSPPSIIGYSRPHGTSVSSYKFTWKSARCQDGSVLQYQLQFTESCSMTVPVTVITGSNTTSTTVVIPSCSSIDCYVRVRAELRDGSFTDYSTCVLIKNQFVEHERFIEQYFQDVCVPIQGECDTGSSSEFFINGQLTLWPDPPTQQYNITYSPTSRAYSFCFTNTTAPITIAEYCHQDHSAGCSLCSVQSGELVFQTRSEILIFSPLPALPENTGVFHTLSKSAVSLSVTTTASMTVISYDRLNDMNVTESHFLLIVGGISVGSACVLIIITLLVVLITLRCQRRSRETDHTTCSGNIIYDEPSLPDPVYQEVEVQLSNNMIDMKRNDAYCQVNVPTDNTLIL